jgi:thiol:disulfide interchange protein DsbD
MKKIVVLLVIVLAFAKGNAQLLNPVKWTTQIEKKSNENYVLIFNGVIDTGWHLYSQFTAEGGSLPLEVLFKNQKGNFELIGKTKESKTKTAYNDIFEVNETFFEKKAQLTQEIKLLNSKLAKVEVALNYQVCKEACINLEKSFTFKIPSPTTDLADAQPISDTTNTVVDTAAVVNQTEAATTVETTLATESTEEEMGLWSIFIIAFFSGFAALLTPCVFPMIPMTVSFFTKQSKSKSAGVRNALFYGISIIVIYVILGVLVTWIFGADALNALSTNVWFNLFFFALLVVFAVSFLGAFEIMLPNSWANKVDSQADRGGVIGILFMALALAIVSFSCTGPIVGTLLVQAASKGGIAPIVGMLGFSLALALPFMLFAMFPGWLNSLPKSGGWLNTVKVVLGFLELALAFKFLSNADLVLQLHLLEREVFLAIWIAIFGTLALYLFGNISLPHDSPMSHISVGRLSLGLVVLSFTVYMIPGLWGAPLQLINAFPPPMEYSESPLGIGVNSVSSVTQVSALPEGAKLGPHQIVVFDDYDKGLAYAKTVNKPIMLDFTGRACVNCRKMENNVWSDERILSILKNQVVVISLYVDDKRELPATEQFVSKTTGSRIETIGDKWTDFMISKYKTNTQPLYVLTDLEVTSLNLKQPTISFVGIEEYESWLQEGLSNFKK